MGWRWMPWALGAALLGCAEPGEQVGSWFVPGAQSALFVDTSREPWTGVARDLGEAEPIRRLTARTGTATLVLVYGERLQVLGVADGEEVMTSTLNVSKLGDTKPLPRALRALRPDENSATEWTEVDKPALWVVRPFPPRPPPIECPDFEVTTLSTDTPFGVRTVSVNQNELILEWTTSAGGDRRFAHRIVTAGVAPNIRVAMSTAWPLPQTALLGGGSTLLAGWTTDDVRLISTSAEGLLRTAPWGGGGDTLLALGASWPSWVGITAGADPSSAGSFVFGGSGAEPVTYPLPDGGPPMAVAALTSSRALVLTEGRRAFEVDASGAVQAVAVRDGVVAIAAGQRGDYFAIGSSCDLLHRTAAGSTTSRLGCYGPFVQSLAAHLDGVVFLNFSGDVEYAEAGQSVCVIPLVNVVFNSLRLVSWGSRFLLLSPYDSEACTIFEPK